MSDTLAMKTLAAPGEALRLYEEARVMVRRLLVAIEREGWEDGETLDEARVAAEGWLGGGALREEFEHGLGAETLLDLLEATRKEVAHEGPISAAVGILWDDGERRCASRETMIRAAALLLIAASRMEIEP